MSAAHPDPLVPTHPAEPRRALVLASSSAYRRALLERLRYPFTVDAPAIDETPRAHETPSATACRLARDKAQVVAARRPRAVVIGSDQVAVCDGRQLGKPGGHAAALAQLQAMRGREVDFHTAVCVIDGANDVLDEADIVTRVRFRVLSDAVLDAYLRAETPYDVAGSAKSEGLGIALLESVASDDPTALVGLPLVTVTHLLLKAGLDLFGSR